MTDAPAALRAQKPGSTAAGLARLRRLRKADNLVRAALLALPVAFVPLVRVVALQEQFNLPKALLAGWVVTLALVWWLGGALMGRRFRIRTHPLTGAFAAFFAAHVLGWLVAALSTGSSLALAGERLSLITAAFLYGLLLVDFARGRRKYLLALGWMQILSAAITAVWVLSDDFIRPAAAVTRLPDWRGYLSAGLGNSGHIADWIALSFPTAMLMLLRVRRTWQAALLALHLGVAAMALIVCWSVHSNLGLIMAMLLFAVLVLRRAGGTRLVARRAGRLAALAVLWAMALAFYLTPQPLNPHQPNIVAEAFSSGRWKEGGSTRVLIWQGTLAMIFERPILGWGTGNFTYGYPQAYNHFAGEDSTHAAMVGQWTNAAHNELLQTWAELGLPGLLALCALMWLWGHGLWRALGRGNPINDDIRLVLLCMGIMTALHAMMNFPMQLPSFLFFHAALAVMPLCLVDRNRALREESMTFEFRFPGIEITLRGMGMKNLQGVDLTPHLPRWAAAGVMLVAVALALWSARNTARQLAAWARYNEAYLLVQHQPGMADWLAEVRASQALELWPGLADARADRAKLRYRVGFWDGVIDDVDAALPRLQSPKLYFWRAEARVRMGHTEGAFDDLVLVLGRLRPWLTGNEVMVQAGDMLRQIQQSPPGTLFRQL